MSRSARERWTFTFELPVHVGNGRRRVAKLLKRLLRVWNVRCTAVLDESAAGTHHLRQDATNGGEAGDGPSSTSATPVHNHGVHKPDAST